MTPEERDILADVERDEQWLHRNALPPPEPASMEHIKLQVRIAADEQWLKTYRTPEVNPACVDRLKRAMRRQLDHAGDVAAIQRRVSGWVPTGSAIASLAAAAVVVVGFLIGLQPPRDDSAADVGNPLDDLIAVVEERESDNARSLAMLRDELDEIEAALAGSGWANTYDARVEDLDGEIDNVMEQLDSTLDGSEYPA